MSVIYNSSDQEPRVREHQVVIFGNNQPIQFQEALEHREKLIRRKREILDELKKIELTADNLTEAIEVACDHDWETEIQYSAGEKDVSHYCKICWKQGYGKAPQCTRVPS